MYHSRPILTWGLKQKQKETEKQVLYKYRKGQVPENGEGRSSRNVRTTAKMHLHKTQISIGLPMLSHPELRNLDICWHMQRSGVQPRFYYLGVVRPDTNIILIRVVG